MGDIIVVSPDYLEAIKEIAEEFSFDFYGYGNAAIAKQHLGQFFADDLLGMVVVADKLSGVDGLAELAEAYNLIGKKKLLLVGKDLTALPDLSRYSLFITCVKVELVTDVVIKQQVFGPILLYNYEPYLYKDRKEESFSFESCTRLVYQPVFPTDFYLCMQEVDVLDTMEKTLAYDKPYNSVAPIVADIRYAKVLSIFYPERIREKLSAIDEAIRQLDNGWEYVALLETLFGCEYRRVMYGRLKPFYRG